MRCLTYHGVSTIDQNWTLAPKELRAAARRGMELVEESGCPRSRR
jgi:hypothetical protein